MLVVIALPCSPKEGDMHVSAPAPAGNADAANIRPPAADAAAQARASARSDAQARADSDTRNSRPAQALHREVRISVDDDGDTFMKVVDRETGETVIEIPPEELMRQLEAIERVSGALFDRMV